MELIIFTIIIGTMENDIIANTANCPNCQAEMAITDKFCNSCGQKVQRKIPKLGELLSEFFDSVLNIDSKIIKTFVAIFIPAQLTIQYFKGIRKKYYQPFRLFFVVTVLFFTVLGLTGLKKTIMSINDSEGLKGIREKVQTAKRLKEVRDSVVIKFEEKQVVESVFDTLETEFRISKGDTIDINIAGNYGEFKIAETDLITLSGQEIVDKYEIVGFWNQLLAKQMIKIIKDPSGFTWYILGNLIWMLIFLMPAVAAVLKLLYIRRKRYFVEHLTFLFHFHAFTFFLSTLIIVIAWYFEKDWVYFILVGWVTVYLYAGMKRFYKQGWFKTLVKFFIMGMSYFFLSTIFFVFLMLISLAIF
jgi:hypothetical protein